MDELILKLIALVEDASPRLWDIALTQVSIELSLAQKEMIVWNIIFAFGILLILGCVVAGFLNDDPDYFGYAFSVFIICLLLAIPAWWNYRDIVGFQGNPEYYAIKELMQLIPSN